MASGIFNKSLRIAEWLCAQARDHGFLAGKLDSHWMAGQLFGCQRPTRQGWQSGYITLEQYRQRVLIDMLMVYAGGSVPAFHEGICAKLEELIAGQGI